MPVTDSITGGNMAPWLQYLSQMLGVSPQQLTSMMAQRGAGMGYPALQGGVPNAANVTGPIAASALPTGGPSVNGQSPTTVTQPDPTPPAPASNRPYVNAPTVFGPQSSPNAGPPPQPAYNPLSGGSANTGLPSPGYAGSTGATGGVPVANIGASGGASGQGAMSNPRFVPGAMPNQDPLGRGGMRGGGAAPQMGMLNLAGLFNRAPGPTGGPAAAPQGAVAGPLARPDLAQRVPLNQTPMPPTGRPNNALPNWGNVALGSQILGNQNPWFS